MAFKVKNITKSQIGIFNINLLPNNVVDLLETIPVATVKASLLNGELYNKIMGRHLAIQSPMNDWSSLGLTTDEFSRLVYTGMMKGYLGNEELKPPFRFDHDGYLQVSSEINVEMGDVHVEIDAYYAPAGNKDNLYILGTSDGSISGVPIVAKFRPDGYQFCSLPSDQRVIAQIDAYSAAIGDKDNIYIGGTLEGTLNGTPVIAKFREDGYQFVSLDKLNVTQRDTLVASGNADGNPVGLVGDAYGRLIVNPGVNDDGYTVIRLLSGAVADTTEPPLASSFVTIGGHTPGAFVELGFEFQSFGGTISASSMTIKTWRLMSNGMINKVDEFTIDTALALYSAAGSLVRRIIPFSASRIYTTITYSDGTLPTGTGGIWARPLNPGAAGLQKADLTFDPDTKALLTQNLGYDSVTDSIKITETSPITYDTSNFELVTHSNVAVNTYTYYLSMQTYGYVSWQMIVGLASVVTIQTSLSTLSDPSAIPAGDWVEISSMMGAASYGPSNSFIHFWANKYKTCWIRFSISVTNATNTCRILVLQGQ